MDKRHDRPNRNATPGREPSADDYDRTTDEAARARAGRAGRHPPRRAPAVDLVQVIAFLAALALVPALAQAGRGGSEGAAGRILTGEIPPSVGVVVVLAVALTVFAIRRRYGGR